MKLNALTCGMLFVAMVSIGACRASGVGLTQEDWASSRYETLFQKTWHSPQVARAIRDTELATVPDLKTLAGIAYRVGSGVEKDLSIAKVLLSAACDSGQMRGCRDYGKVLIELGDPAEFKRAADLFRQSCDAGIVFGCNDLVTAYVKGYGVERDLAMAAAYAERACVAPAELICSEAGTELATADLKAGLIRLAAACEAGGVMACHRSGTFRMESADARLHAVGLEHHDAACNGGIVFSCEAIIMERDRHERGTENVVHALKLVSRACAEGYIDGCYRLMYAYSDLGVPGIPSNDAKVFQYTQTACGHGDQESCRWTAEALEAGKGTAQDIEEAASIYRWLCTQGDSAMCHQAARLEAADSGLIENNSSTNNTVSVTERACELGDGEACRGIAWWHVFGEEGRTKDVSLATAHFIAGCDKGASNACIDIASLHDWAQFGFPEDKNSARAFYQRACDLNDPLGCELLKESGSAKP